MLLLERGTAGDIEENSEKELKETGPRTFTEAASTAEDGWGDLEPTAR